MNGHALAGAVLGLAIAVAVVWLLTANGTILTR